MTEPYQQCTIDDGMQVLRDITPFMRTFLASVPEDKQALYVSGLFTICIARLTKEMGEDAMKLFLERAIADIPMLAKLGEDSH